MGSVATKAKVFVNCFHWQKFIENIFCISFYAVQVIACLLQVMVFICIGIGIGICTGIY